MTVLFTILVFLVDVLIAAAAQTAVFMCLCCAAKIPLKKLVSYGRYILPLIVLVIGLQMVWGQGLFTGVMIACRIMTLTLLMPLLTVTTPAPLLALGITRLGFPYKAAFVITSTLNLIPSFEESARSIMDARRLRGMKRITLTEYSTAALPLIIMAMRQAQMTGLAMDCRAFGAYQTRTWLREIHFSALDYGAFAAGAVLIAAIMTANVLLK